MRRSCVRRVVMQPNMGAMMDHGHHDHSEPSAPIHGGVTVKDPVCGMNVTVGLAKGGSVTHGGHEYSFCSPKCREKFLADPAKYLGVAAAPITAEEPDTIYTCPMHPEVRQRGPGTCPKCGMALEPEMPTAEEGPNPELVDMTRRFWISAAITVPLLVLAMGELVGFVPFSASTRTWIELVLATPVVVWAGAPFFHRG
ncbi:MAG: heavy metal-binding domain-containing protein, partial [Kofleriaceae bacterium]